MEAPRLWRDRKWKLRLCAEFYDGDLVNTIPTGIARSLGVSNILKVAKHEIPKSINKSDFSDAAVVLALHSIIDAKLVCGADKEMIE